MWRDTFKVNSIFFNVYYSYKNYKNYFFKRYFLKWQKSVIDLKIIFKINFKFTVQLPKIPHQGIAWFSSLCKKEITSLYEGECNELGHDHSPRGSASWPSQIIETNYLLSF